MAMQGDDDLLLVGVTYVNGTVTGPSGESVLVEFLVDSGARYSLLPHEVWTRLGLQANKTQGFQLADGSVIHRGMSECHVTFEFGAGHTPVILGDPGDAVPLVGVITLEEFGLLLDPVSRTLRKERLLPLLRLTA